MTTTQPTFMWSASAQITDSTDLSAPPLHEWLDQFDSTTLTGTLSYAVAAVTHHVAVTVPTDTIAWVGTSPAERAGCDELVLGTIRDQYGDTVGHVTIIMRLRVQH